MRPEGNCWGLIQTVVPHYRIGVITELVRLLEGRNRTLTVFSGDINSYGNFNDAAGNAYWRRKIRNFYLLGKRFIVQPIPLKHLLRAEIVILELNPRILSNWLLLILRLLLRKPIVFWGQAWSRSGPGSPTNILRLIMWYCAWARIAYTETEAIGLSRLGLRAFPARNALYSRKHMMFERNNLDRPTPSRFIIVGRLGVDKKIHVAVQAIALLQKKGIDVILDIVGDGVESIQLHRLAKELNVEAKVIFHGFIEADKIAPLMFTALASLSPGYVGLSAVQSFFFGVPMLIADNEPHSSEIEACVEGWNSLYFRSNSPESLAQLMTKMIHNRENLLANDDQIARAIREKYSIETMAQTFIDASFSTLHELRFTEI